MRRAFENDGSLTAGIAVGLAASATVGVGLILAYLLFRRQSFAPRAVECRLEPMRALPERTHVAVDQIDRSSVRHNAQIRTVPLPSLTDAQEPPRLGTGPAAGETGITVRVLGPSGSFAVFAFHVGDFAALSVAGVPVGETLIVPAGGDQRLALRPGQTLRAKGSTTGVLVSVVHDERFA